MLSLGNVRECEACLMAHPPLQHLLCPLGCHDNPPTSTAGDDAGSRLSREGHLWALTGLVACLWEVTTVRTAHPEKAAMGRSQWDHSFMTLLALMAVQTQRATIAWAHWLLCTQDSCLLSGDGHVSAAFSARWLCYVLNSASKMSILNLRWLIAIANIEKCSSWKALVRIAPFLIPFNWKCNRTFEPLVMIESSDY